MLQWDWKNKVGEVEIFNYDKVVTYNLYEGNAFLIMLYEYEEDGKQMYSLHNFFADETHAKEIADKEYSKGTISTRCRDALANYIIEETD